MQHFGLLDGAGRPRLNQLYHWLAQSTWYVHIRMLHSLVSPLLFCLYLCSTSQCYLKPRLDQQRDVPVLAMKRHCQLHHNDSAESQMDAVKITLGSAAVVGFQAIFAIH